VVNGENSNETDTTYSNGTGVGLVGTTFSIGQPVATNDTVTFKNITLSRDTLSFPVEPVIFYDDPLNGGTLAQIQMSGDGLSAGKLQFYTKETGAGSLTEKLTIKENGNVGIGVAAPSHKLEVDGDIKAVGTISAPTFAPTYTSIPSLAGKIGQTVNAVDSPVTLVFNAEIQVLSLTIPYTGVWSISMSLYLGNAGGLSGQILYPTSIKINGSITHNFYGTNLTGVNGTITRNLSVNDVFTFSTYLTGSGASGLSASERGVWFGAYTFLSATRIA
jgi:hypothetical protein